MSATALFAQNQSVIASAGNAAGTVEGQSYRDETLRVDLMLSGSSSSVSVSLRSMSVTDGWYGRRCNLSTTPVKGNGEILLVNSSSGATVYSSSFSTLFQEWLATDEARTVSKSFENTFLLPMPLAKSSLILRLFDNRGDVMCENVFPVDPDDILIERKARSDVRSKYIHRGGDPARCIDVAIIAEGYGPSEKGKFFKDAGTAAEAILSHEPFKKYSSLFNFIAIFNESEDSGVSVPREGTWKRTAVGSHFDTFYMDRYLTTSHVFAVHDLLSGLPYEHLVILANTDVYGGGGIYNSYTLTTAHHKLFKPVVVHEFGHSFGALADEYDYDNPADPYYIPSCEPWEQNITTMFDFNSKWKDMLDADVPGAGLFEGAGYQQKGVWRPAEDCRMRSNTPDAFCPVCQRALERMILFYTSSIDSF